MSIFGFEKSFIDAVNEIEVTGFKKHYVDIYSNKVVCIIDENSVVYDIKSNIMEDQNRYIFMAQNGAIVEVKSQDVNEGVKFSDFARGEYLHEAKPAYIVYFKNPNGVEKAYVSKTGDLIYSVAPDNPKGKITGKDLESRYGTRNSPVSDFKEVTMPEDKAIKAIDKKIALGWDVKSIDKI